MIQWKKILIWMPRNVSLCWREREKRHLKTRHEAILLMANSWWHRIQGKGEKGGRSPSSLCNRRFCKPGVLFSPFISGAVTSREQCFRCITCSCAREGGREDEGREEIDSLPPTTLLKTRSVFSWYGCHPFLFSRQPIEPLILTWCEKLEL